MAPGIKSFYFKIKFPAINSKLVKSVVCKAAWNYLQPEFPSFKYWIAKFKVILETYRRITNVWKEITRKYKMISREWKAKIEICGVILEMQLKFQLCLALNSISKQQLGNSMVNFNGYKATTKVLNNKRIN